MKILFLSAVLPYPLYSGGQIRIYNLLKKLSEKHEIHLYAFIREQQENSWKKDLSFCASVTTVYRGRAGRLKYVASAVLGKYPLLLSTYNNAEMRTQIETALSQEQFDVVHLEPGYVWPSLPHTKIPLVVAEHNIEHRIYQEYVDSAKFPWLRPFMQHDVDKLEQWEKKIWEQASRVVAVSNDDAKEIEELGARSVAVVPNGVNEGQFTFLPKKSMRKNFQCLFVGDFRWLQNRDAIKFLLTDVWPTISSNHPESKLCIVGRDFPSALQSLINPSIFVQEYVEDITSIFHETDILLAPIRIGGGTKYKILEAMACGVPIITTTKGVDGLVADLKEAVIVAKELKDWEAGVTRFVTDLAFRVSLVKTARKGIEKNYTWSTIAKKLDTVWEQVYAKHH